MTGTYLLDTCAFLKAVVDDGKALGANARRIILNPDNWCLLSPVSIAEMGILTSIGRLKMTAVTLLRLMEDVDVTVLPYRREHALHYFSLPPVEATHRDPHDRMIIAAALAEDIPILTSDEAFQKYPGLQVIW